MTSIFALSSNLHPFPTIDPAARTIREAVWMIWLAAILSGFFLFQSSISYAGQNLPCRINITSKDAVLVADPDGRILYEKNQAKKLVPASTIKILTALAALNHFGPSFRFRTEFYRDPFQNLKVKGYGDPLLTSEVLQGLADYLSTSVRFQDIILDNTYFFSHINIPGCGNSTNPYDAPVGALCANFNTVIFRRDGKGRIISSERQTPMIPFARDRIRSLGLERGRHTFLDNSRDAARYAGELLLHFLRKRGVKSRGIIRFGPVGHDDTLIYTYESIFTLETVVQKMLKSSSNFMANQILIALGASVYGSPGTLAKGVRAVTYYAKNKLELQNIKIVEGSGISRQNRISALEMLIILEKFKPYRYLLKRNDNMLYKTGSLKGIRTKVGYIGGYPKGPYYFVIFFNRRNSDMNAAINCVKKAIAH